VGEPVTVESQVRLFWAVEIRQLVTGSYRIIDSDIAACVGAFFKKIGQTKIAANIKMTMNGTVENNFFSMSPILCFLRKKFQN